MKSAYLLIFTLLMLVLCWEYDRVDAAITSQAIPDESIRLRILAHSDAAGDQWIKHQLRQEIVQFMETRVKGITDIDRARENLRLLLPEINQLVKTTLEKHGFTYSFTVYFGETSFPAKIYGQKVYPAGQYEALRITLGEGAGKNWWCVLFPPLCFIDIAAGEAFADSATLTVSEKELTRLKADEEPEVRFFVAELFRKWKERFNNKGSMQDD